MKFKFVILFFVFAIILLIYYFPYQRFIALKDFNKYITEQGVDESNIKSKEVYKDYKQDGYVITVVYEDDPYLVYDYKWYVGKSYKETFNILLTVYKEIGGIYGDPQIKPKYPRLYNPNNYSQ